MKVGLRYSESGGWTIKNGLADLDTIALK